MQALAILAILAASANANVLHARASCNADLCARSVTGTANPTPNRASRLADCASFFTTTIIPPTTTPTTTLAATTTFTTTSVVTVGGTTVFTTVLYTPPSSPKKRDVGEIEERQAVTSTTIVPTSVPAYASPCSGAARYSSACSCANIPRSTTVLASPIATNTVTSYLTTVMTASTSIINVATLTETFTACQPTNNYDYKYSLDGVGGTGADFDAVNNAAGNDDPYICCGSCYEAGAVNCAGTIREGNVCTVYYTRNGAVTNDQCPGGIGFIRDITGTTVQLATCGRVNGAST